MRETPDNVVHLRENEVFVFGSNEAGIHGAGAAHQARQWGARTGQGFGLAGSTFAIPSKDFEIRTLPVVKIKEYVDKFYDYASKHPEKIFLVTEIGCGLAGYRPEQIAPLFEPCMSLKNVFLPRRFWHVLKQKVK